MKKMVWSRTGGDVVECDAVEPRALAKMCEDAIEEHFDRDLYAELKDKQAEEKAEYKKALKEYVKDIGDEE